MSSSPIRLYFTSFLNPLQVGKEFRKHIPADVRHHDDVGEVLRFVVGVQMHRCERVLLDDRVTGTSEVDRIRQRVGSRR